VTASAHNRRDVMQGFARGADLLFLSPVFATRSHPGARVLGPLRFGLMARGAPGPVLALGGMDAARWRRLRPLGAEGFGGIDFWAGN
jgi:thiamine-phosphate pyrophosphorylase